MRATNHDYQGCLVGNYYDSNMTGIFNSWDEFSKNHSGFLRDGFDDTYHYVFRYDIYEQDDGKYMLELCIMLQRKGIYTHLYVKNISQSELETVVRDFLIERKKYLMSLWDIEGV